MEFLGNDSDSEVDFTINEKYARSYDTWRRGQEIQRIKDKYGDVDDSDSSESEEEDEDGKELTKDVEKQFFKTLSCLKEKNPKIYDQNTRFFDAENKNEDADVKKKSEPSLTLAGYQRKVLLETGGQFSDDEDVKEDHSFEMMSSQDQEHDIKQSFKDVLKDSDNENEDENWGNLFTKRVKTVEELEKEEDDYRQWLAGENEKLKNAQIKEDLKGLHDYWTDPKLNEGEKFLRDYILNKRYLDNEDKSRIPSYDEIVHDSDMDLSADESMINEQDEFEKKYNFRFEEPDHEFIKRYPRTLEQSMRKKDDRRKKHREEVKQRKLTERSKKDEELKRLKTLKKKEILDKIKRLQQITGNDDIAFQSEDLEGDFDPKNHDKRMSEIFDEEYYGVGGDEEEKPEFPELDEELEMENWDEWEGYEGEEEELHCEDPGFNMDCDYDPTKKKELQKELIENSKRHKRKKKSKFAEAVAKEKPVFDPRDKTFEQYVDEYYSLDYEDLIGDIPCRFKYRKVVPNDFGLSIEEILNATDQELNRWVSIKKIVSRLPEHVELYDVKAYKRKAANLNKKVKCFPSLFGPKSEEDEQPFVQEKLPPTVEEEKQKKKRKKRKNAMLPDDADNDAEEGIEDSLMPTKKKKKIAKIEEQSSEILYKSEKVDADANVHGGRQEKSKKNKIHMNGEAQHGEVHKTLQKFIVTDVQGTGSDELSGRSGKKKKKKNKQSNGEVMLDEVEKSPQKSAKSKKKRKLQDCSEVDISERSEIAKKGNPLHFKKDVSDVSNGNDNKKNKMSKKKSKGEKKQQLQCSGNSPIGLEKASRETCNKSDRKRRKASHEEVNNTPFEGRQKVHKKRKFHNNDEGENNVCNLSDERLKSYGLNPKKFKNKLKYKNRK